MTKYGFNDDETLYSDFACSCGDDSRAKMTELHEWVTTHIYDGKSPKPEFYVTSMLYALAGNYRAWIADVPLDPGGWGAVVVEAEENEGFEGSKLRADIQFDRFEDGLALALKAMYEKYGPSRTYHEKDV